MINEPDCVFFNVLGEVGWLVGWITLAYAYIYKERKKERKKNFFEAFTE
jgi:hypothetical protein